eukprot:TRINITY_DN30184_c0_g1_i1.p1 TRINITY_DN30184_c0_g1~~TRINITY_DN30184_c0_g1_i1.p1  ORF type:complete len:365 (+),score=67.07 TRINITY_DN30184_c0_g1_i1:120-1214(+)
MALVSSCFSRPLWRIAAALVAASCVAAAASGNYYDTLEIPKDAPVADVKKAYKRLALKWHPDKNKDPEASKKFREVAEAYEVLSVAERRRQYDSGDAGFDFGGFDFPTADDIFREFFGDEDPFAGFARMGEQMEKEFQEAFGDFERMASETKQVESSMFGSVGSFFSSFFSSSTGDGTGTKTVSQTVDVKSMPDGSSIKRTVKSDGTAKTESIETINAGLSEAASSALSGDDVCGAHGRGSDGSCKTSASSTPEAVKLDGRSSSAPSAAQASDLCGAASIRGDSEPSDQMVKHVDGSACCNSAPMTSPTDPRGCCERCIGNKACDVFVLQPSTGACWLLRWVDSRRDVTPSRDRLMGEKPVIPA